MTEDRTVELARLVAGAVVRDVERAERPLIYAAAHEISINPRAAERFGLAVSTAIVVELRSVQTSALDTVFPTLKEK